MDKVLHSKIPDTNISCNDLFEQHQPKDSECLVTIQDYSLVPDALFAAFSQVTTCYANDSDCRNIGRNRPKIDPGFKGICCLHCQGEGNAFRFFPASSESLSQIDTCSKLSNHMLRKCKHIPPTIRRAIEIMKEKEKEEPRRYGSRKIFFNRFWAKLHPNGVEAPGSQVNMDLSNVSLEIDSLLEQSTLVKAEDKGLVSDGFLAVFCLLKSCTLTEADKKGWYRDREIGFPGLCCKFCSGRKTSGRYFPKGGPFFLRSSKHAIIRHLETCETCPDEIKKKIYALHKIDEERVGWKVNEATQLGSGKQFYERLWRRYAGSVFSATTRG
jgi:hypothetical protein